MSIQKYLTVREAAEILRLHPDSIRTAIKTGRLSAHRSGPHGRYLITEKAIEAFLKPALTL